MHRWFPASVCAALLLGGTAWGNDGYLSSGGSPNLMRGHPSISMLSEVVRLTVGEKYIDVDCRFVFRNNGPARVVRMGFPEEISGAYETSENERQAEGQPPKSSFSVFRSFVGGKPARTRLVRGTGNTLWHVKEVRFPAQGALTVRDVYRQEVGVQVVSETHGVAQAGYTLHTGGSWHGPIGRAEVIVTFRRAGMGKLHPVPIRVAGTGDEARENWESGWTGNSGRVYYRGPSKPLVRGSQLAFVRRNWRPTRRDDVRLVFGCKRLRLFAL